MSQSIYYRWALDLTWHFPHPVCLISAQAPLHNPVIHTLPPPHGTEEHLHLVPGEEQPLLSQDHQGQLGTLGLTPQDALVEHRHQQHPHGVE